MGSRIYVGNLRIGISEETVAALFRPFGCVLKVVLPLGRDTGAPRGFAFVTMGSPAEAASALAAMTTTQVDGRSITLQPAEEVSCRH